MNRTLLKTLTGLILLSGLATCSTGPGTNLKIEGTYEGTLQGTPKVSILLTVSGNSISGTGTIDQLTNSNVWRGTPGATNHVTFTGSRDGRKITALSGLMNMQMNLTPGGSSSTWVDASTTIALLPAEFTNNGGIMGLWQGDVDLGGGDIRNIGGSWSAVRTGGRSTGITGPPR